VTQHSAHRPASSRNHGLTISLAVASLSALKALFGIAGAGGQAAHQASILILVSDATIWPVLLGIAGWFSLLCSRCWRGSSEEEAESLCCPVRSYIAGERHGIFTEGKRQTTSKRCLNHIMAAHHSAAGVMTSIAKLKERTAALAAHNLSQRRLQRDIAQPLALHLYVPLA